MAWARSSFRRSIAPLHERYERGSGSSREPRSIEARAFEEGLQAANKHLCVSMYRSVNQPASQLNRDLQNKNGRGIVVCVSISTVSKSLLLAKGSRKGLSRLLLFFLLFFCRARETL